MNFAGAKFSSFLRLPPLSGVSEKNANRARCCFSAVDVIADVPADVCAGRGIFLMRIRILCLIIIRPRASTRDCALQRSPRHRRRNSRFRIASRALSAFALASSPPTPIPPRESPSRITLLVSRDSYFVALIRAPTPTPYFHHRDRPLDFPHEAALEQSSLLEILAGRDSGFSSARSFWKFVL